MPAACRGRAFDDPLAGGRLVGGRVRGDRFVTITSATERLQGYGFEADQDLRNYTVFGKVSGQAEIETK